MPIDFAWLAARLLSQSHSLLAEWFPNGKLAGHEFKVGDLHGSPGKSLSINVNTGAWKDFATGEAGGDMIALYAAMHGIKQAEAVKALDDSVNLSRVAPAAPTEPAKKREKWTPILPVPDDAPKPSDDFYRKSGDKDWIKLPLVKRWPYLNAAGALLGYAARFEWYEGSDLKKDIIPQTYCINESGRKQWRWRAFSAPRPLYGLDQLHARPTAPVIIVEGEKKVEALKVLAPQYVGISWPGGAAAWKKADWSPLYGRSSVLCWPDADKQVITTEAQAAKFKLNIGDLIPGDQQPGMRAMWEIGHHLLKQCPVVKIIIPDDDALPDGWDCADAVADGWDWQRFKTWAMPRVVNLTERGNHDAGRTDGNQRRDESSGPAETAATEKPPADETQASVGNRGPASSVPDNAGASVADQRPTDRPDGARQRAASDRQRNQDAGDRDPENRGAARPATGLQRANGIQTPAPAGAQAGSEEPRSQIACWEKWNLERAGNGLPVANLANAVRVLENDSRLRGVIWYDEFLRRFMTGSPAREWGSNDVRLLQLHMQAVVGISKIGKDTVSDAAAVVAHNNTTNCVRDWIDSLPAWDGVGRIDEFMHRVFGCELNIYTMAASRNFWISMIARVYRPGCKVDNMIILEGGQGVYKSTALRAIADPWFAEQHESAQNPKAFAEILQGKLLTEVAEMDAFSRAEVNTIKKIVSCQEDRFRIPFDTSAKDFPRQGIMAATTNKDDWNRDETGARRFWPIKCGGYADIDYIKEHRAQCFAEALAEFKAGASWWNMPEAETRREQDKRRDEDVWLEPMSGWLVGRSEVTIMQVALSCLGFRDAKDVDRASQMRAARVLVRLGWTNGGNKKVAGSVRRVWVAPGDSYGSDLSKGSDLTVQSSIMQKGEVATSSDLDGINKEVATLQNDIPFNELDIGSNQ